jgi:hypothetical protein
MMEGQTSILAALCAFSPPSTAASVVLKPLPTRQFDGAPPPPTLLNFYILLKGILFCFFSFFSLYFYCDLKRIPFPSPTSQPAKKIPF